MAEGRICVRNVVPPPAIQAQLKDIYRDFIQPGALYEIRIPWSLRRELIRDFDPLTSRRQRKKSVWSINARRISKVFVSGLVALPEHNDETSVSPAKLLEEGLAGGRSTMTPASADGGINYASAINHLDEASLIAEELLTEKVRSKMKGAPLL